MACCFFILLLSEKYLRHLNNTKHIRFIYMMLVKYLYVRKLNKAITENLTADEQNEMSVLLEKMGQSLTKEARSES